MLVKVECNVSMSVWMQQHAVLEFLTAGNMPLNDISC